MTTLRLRGRATLLAASLLAAGAVPLGTAAHAQTYSSPLALAADDTLLFVVNPHADSVTVIDTAANAAIGDPIPVGDEPRSIAVDSRRGYVLVANAAGSSVTVLRIVNEDPAALDIEPVGEFTTGAEPWSVVISPDGRRGFVANSSQDTITVLSLRGNDAPSVLGHVDLRRSVCNAGDSKRHFQSFGLAVNEDNDQLYTARLLSFTSKNGVQGDDEGKVGVVCRLDIDTRSNDIEDYEPAARIKLAPQVTGFEFPGFDEDTSAFPNQLQSIVIRGDRAYLPNIAASPSPPLRFNTDTQAFVNQIGGIGDNTQTDEGALNLHLGARDPEVVDGTPKKKLFFANVWAIAFNESNAYVVSAGSDLLVKLDVEDDGSLAFTVDDDTTRYIDLNDPTEGSPTAGENAGKNPRGIVINEDGDTAYVANFVSRNVSVVDLTTDEVVDVIPTSDPPAPGSEDEVVQVGAEMFFSSRGHFDRPDGIDDATSTDERLSSEGWQNCASCHFEGLTDGVVFVFGTGPRKSIPLNASFNPADPTQQKILNYSAIFDEIEDFEINIRTVSGPVPPAGAPNDPNHGLLFDDGGNINLAPAVINAFALPNADRNQFTVTLPGSTTAVPSLTALREWVRLAIRTPNGPLDSTEIDGGVSAANVARGRALFQQAGCQTCHGGSHWTINQKDFVSPPDPADIFTETDPNGPDARPNPVGNQFLNRFLFDVGSFNAGVEGEGNPIGNDIGAPELANAAPNAAGELVLPDGLGFDHNGDGAGNGFNIPSLLGIHAVQPYLHNGACETLVCVLESEEHRTAGHQTDVLNSQKKRNKVAKFLETIDLETEPFEVP